MMNRFGAAVAAAALVVGSAATAQAQVTGAVVPEAEIGLGYQLLHVGGDTSNTFPLGFNVDVVRNLGQFGLVFEGGLARDATDVPGVAVTWNYLHFGAGPRFDLLRDGGTMRPYVQVLGGLSHARFSSDFDTEVLPDVDESDSAFMLQPGVGLSIDNGGRWGFTGSIDYRRAFFDAGPGLGLSNTNEFRVFLGVRMFIR